MSKKSLGFSKSSHIHFGSIENNKDASLQPQYDFKSNNDLVLDNGGDKLFTAIIDVPVLAGTTKPIYTTALVITQLTTSWSATDTTVHLWAAPATPTEPLTSISYSINATNPTNFIPFGQPLSTEGAVGSLVGMTALEVATARLSFHLWDDLISTTLVESGGAAANITLNYSSATSGNGTYSTGLTYSTLPNKAIVADQIWINSNTAIWPDNSDAGVVNGGYGFQTMMHEIGHSLGLSHPGLYNGTANYNTDVVFAQDNREFTIMSYFGVYDTDPLVNAWTATGTTSYALNPRYIYSQTPMVYDIAAIQSLYGADTTTRKGDTVYGYNCNFVTDAIKDIYNFSVNVKPILTIYDAGGANDALDCSGGNTNQSIDLTPGSYSSVNGLNYNVGIDVNTIIEKAIGGAGNDTLKGNDAANTLIGGAGIDTMQGGLGNDTYEVTDVGDVVTEGLNEGTDTTWSYIANYTLAANVEQLVLGGTAAINGTGNALDNALTGNAAANILDGGAGNDTLVGGLGNDTYLVDNIGDIVIELLTEGTETVSSSITYSLLDTDGAGANGGNVENLTLTGAAIINGTGNALDNVLIGNAAANVLSGVAGNDTLNGNAGDDTLDGGTGNDSMSGGDGNDIYIVNAALDITTETNALLTGGIDEVRSSVTRTLGDNFESLTLLTVSVDPLTLALNNINGTGNALANSLIGNGGNNILSGLEGDDTLNGGAGADTLIGGIGNDTYFIDNALDKVIELDGAGIDTINSSVSYSLVDTDIAVGTLSSFVDDLTLTGVAAINGTGNALNNIITGNAAANILTGNTGDDTLNGNAGNDTLDGGAGNDVLNGGENADLYVVVDATHKTQAEISDTGLLGIDELRFTSALAGTTLTVHAGDTGLETIVIGTGTAAAAILTGLVALNVDASAVNNALTIIGNAGANSIMSGAGDDTLNSGAGNDTLNGGAGNDMLNGGLGNDSMSGGDGNDIYIVNAALDITTETNALLTGGIDEVRSSVTRTLGDNFESLTLLTVSVDPLTLALNNINGTGNALANSLIGNGGNNILSGLEGDDTLNGGAGADTLIGGIGNDTYFIDNALDKVIELDGAGIDTINSSVSYSLVDTDIAVGTLSSFVDDLTLTGVAAINGTGNALNNIITGNAAANILTGGLGNDILSGGLGQDIFDFNAVIESLVGVSRDIITDFSSAQLDRIDLSTIDANSTLLNDQAFLSAVLTSGAFTSAGQLRLVGNVLSGNTDSDFNTSEFEIQLTGISTMTGINFIL